jgi:polysaccharide export outer membrane protein
MLGSACRHTKPDFSDVPVVPDNTRPYQVGDTITITPLMETASDVYERVKPDGTITLPLVGKVIVEGKTPPAAQDAINEAYRKYYFRDTIRIGEQRNFYVTGEVRGPGRYPYGGDLTVSQAIVAAGDFTDKANRKNVKLIRANGREKMTLNLIRVEAPDPPIYPGDQIIVPRK